ELQRRADTRAGARINARGEQGLLEREQRRLLFVRLERLGRDPGRVDEEEDVGIRAELLEHLHLHLDPRQVGRREGAVFEALRADAEDDTGAASAGPAIGRERDAELADEDV